MKKLILGLLLLLPMFATVGCKSDEDKAKETAEQYLKKMLKNPESLNIESMEIRKDTVPFYLTSDLLSKAEECVKIYKEAESYEGYFSYNMLMKRKNLLEEYIDKIQKLKNEYDSISNDSVDIQYIAYVKSSGTNPMGGRVSSSSIIIIDKDNPKNVLGMYPIDEDFIEKFVFLKKCDDSFNLDVNKFGKIDTNGLGFFEQFIINTAQ